MPESTEEAGKSRNRTSDATVQKKTGMSWQKWFDILDQIGGKDMDHKGIVAYLKKNHAISAWWQQHITVAYEQERGLRQVHEMPDGYQISRSKTVKVPVSNLYQAWIEVDIREKWLREVAFEIRAARRDKSLRINWHDSPSIVEVNFYSKGDEKTQVTVQHSKLESTQQAENMKDFWGQALARLKEVVETSNK
jgi:uncharacterized protein YndB with AHSA1/START domain